MDFEKIIAEEPAPSIALQESLRLYLLMYKIRKAEEMVIALYPTDRLKTPMHMSMGQEAVSVGVITALDRRGDVFSTYRSHAAFLAQTEDLDVFFAEMYGKETGTGEGRNGSMHLSSPEKNHYLSSAIVSSCLPIAVGAGYANKVQKNHRIAAVFFGDGALDEGVFWESLNAACLYKIPVLFICEDNELAVHTYKSQRNGYSSIDRVVNAFDCVAYSEETNDVESIYQTAKKAIEISENTQTPAFLRVRCHRYLEHVGICEDWNAMYRDKKTYDWWYQHDSLKMQKQRLLQLGLNPNEIERSESEIDEQIKQAVDKAERAGFCSPDRLHRGVFCEEN